MPMARLLVLLLLIAAGRARAEAPRHTDVWGFALDVTPISGAALLAEHYPHCAAVRTVYHRSASHQDEVTSALDINAGLIESDPAISDACADSPGPPGTFDGIELRFLHPELDAAQRLYRVDAKRVFTDPVYARDKRIVESFETMRAALFRKYGKPTAARRDKTISASQSLARSLGMHADVEREDYVVRYLWSRKGTLPEGDREDFRCDCGGPYVEAEIEISRSPATVPKNRYYVLSARFRLEDPQHGEAQDAWNAQWLASQSRRR
jgi:hypothetical protein